MMTFIEQAIDDGAILLEPQSVFNQAIVGITDIDGVAAACYSSERVLAALQEQNGWDYETALEWFCHNMAIGGEGAPIYLELVADLREPA